MYEGGFGAAELSLGDLIQEYSWRSLSLTYQSDLLKPLLGIFRVFSTAPTPTRHYWRIAMDCRNIVGDVSAFSPWPFSTDLVKFWNPAAAFKDEYNSCRVVTA
jgi:hypothetical protein